VTRPLGVVLAGGSSRRLGGIPKGLELVGSRRIVDLVVDALRPVSEGLLLAANDPRAPEWLPGVPVVGDTHVGAGGLAGVDAALRSAKGGRDVLVVAWDMPFVTPAALGIILAHADATGADVVVPESDSPYGFEPFCAFYSSRVAESLDAFLGGGGGAAREFIARLARVDRVPLTELAPAGDPGTLFLSVNTPHDLERLRAMASRAQ